MDDNVVFETTLIHYRGEMEAAIAVLKVHVSGSRGGGVYKNVVLFLRKPTLVMLIRRQLEI